MTLRPVPPPEFFRRGHPYSNRCASSGICKDPQHTVEVQSLRRARHISSLVQGPPEPILRTPIPETWRERWTLFRNRHPGLVGGALDMLILIGIGVCIGLVVGRWLTG